MAGTLRLTSSGTTPAGTAAWMTAMVGPASGSKLICGGATCSVSRCSVSTCPTARPPHSRARRTPTIATARFAPATVMPGRSRHPIGLYQ